MIEESKEFRIGDVVEIIKAEPWDEDTIEIGARGVVIHMDEDDGPFVVEFFHEKPGMHDGEGHGRRHRCWWVTKMDVKLIWRTI